MLEESGRLCTGSLRKTCPFFAKGIDWSIPENVSSHGLPSYNRSATHGRTLRLRIQLTLLREDTCGRL